MTDIAGLSRDDATQLMAWSARAMLDAVLDERAITGARRASPRRH